MSEQARNTPKMANDALKTRRKRYLLYCFVQIVSVTGVIRLRAQYLFHKMANKILKLAEVPRGKQIDGILLVTITAVNTC